ncbi:MAG: hypothetical protein LBQ59_00660 [Candidatus Peribacteria bacterium]|jgi:uncharacterized lipoprotein YehR (DUF1307 family)|nr:hypothetical protein [Candidatus Peribacteria bacterium]
MKTLKIFKTAFVLFAMLLALVSCGKKEGENNSSVNNTGEVVVSNGEAKDGDIVLVHYTLFSEE